MSLELKLQSLFRAIERVERSRLHAANLTNALKPWYAELSAVEDLIYERERCRKND